MSASHGEANTRAGFIDRLFELLGWDVRKDKVLVSGQMRAPDYSFRVGGTATFYAEAKRPSAHIKDNADTAYPCVYAAPIRGDGAEL